MAALLERLSAESGPSLWLDYTAYASRLFAGGKPPWLDVTAFAAWLRKSQGLLKSDVIAIPLAPIVMVWLEAHPGLAAAMAEKRRTAYALKTLLANEPLRAHLSAMLASLRGSLGAAPLVLQIPSPRAWVLLAYRQAHGMTDEVEIGADEVDSAAVLVADFLRVFGDAAVDGVLLEEAADREPANTEELGWYQPVINVAAHYRWTVGMHFPHAASFNGEIAGMGFVVAPFVMAGAVAGLDTSANFWSGNDEAATLSSAKFRYAEIPAEAVPEQVLERVAALRSIRADE